MNDLIKALSLCQLSRGFSETEIKELLESITYRVLPYQKGAVIAIEGDSCTSIGIVIEGEVEIEKMYPSGKTIVIDRLKRGNVFGEVIIFSDMKKYPSSIAAYQNSKIMFISKEDIIKICSLNPKALSNFMGILSNKILMLNKKLKNISYHSIKQKIAGYLLDEYKKHKTSSLVLSSSRKAMADELGIPRPSLSRELINMKDEGIIDFDRNIINILDIEGLENLLFE